MLRTTLILSAATLAAAVTPAAAQQRGSTPSRTNPQVTVGPVTLGIGPGGITVNTPGTAPATNGYARPAVPGAYPASPYDPGMQSGYPGNGYGAYAPGTRYSPGIAPTQPAAPTYLYGSGTAPAYPTAPAPTYRDGRTMYGTTAPVPAAESGLRIDELADGPAKSAGLRTGDVILKVGGVRTRTFADVKNTLAQVPDGMAVEIEYRDAATGVMDRRTVAVKGGRIGVTLNEVSVPGT